MTTRPARALGILALLFAFALVLASCTARAPRAASIDVVEGIAYREVAGVELSLDVCLPPNERTQSAPGMLVIHGGAFIGGDRAQPNIRRLCVELAEAGYVAFSIDYRLAPEFIYPAQLEDARAAVAWARDSAQVERFGIDPERIGVIGGSAGAILAGTLGVDGEGPTDAGSRVAAVVSLSGGMVFTSDEPALRQARADRVRVPYLGCDEVTLEACPIAAEAEPIAHVDPTDPPFYLLTSEGESLPEESAELMAAELEAAGVPAIVRTAPGAEHSTQVLTPEIWDEILAFLAEHV